MGTHAILTIRQANMADAEAMARINIDVWRSTYTGIVDGAILNAMELPRYIRKWQDIIAKQETGERWCYVAVEDNEPVGYLAAGRNPDPDDFGAAIYALYLRPEYHGRGIGVRLFDEVLGAFEIAGLQSFKLYVLKDNTLGRRFYDRYAPDIVRDETLAMDGNVYCDMLYGWHHLPIRAVSGASR